MASVNRCIYPDTVLVLKAARCSSVCSLNSLLLTHFLPQMEALEVSLVQISRFLICSLCNLMWSCKSAAEGNFSLQLSSKWHLNPSCKMVKYNFAWFTSKADRKEYNQVHSPPTSFHNWLDGAQQFWLASRYTFRYTKLSIPVVNLKHQNCTMNALAQFLNTLHDLLLLPPPVFEKLLPPSSACEHPWWQSVLCKLNSVKLEYSELDNWALEI